MNNEKSKKEIREQLNRDIEKFLSSGGKVTKVKSKMILDSNTEFS